MNYVAENGANQHLTLKILIDGRRTAIQVASFSLLLFQALFSLTVSFILLTNKLITAVYTDTNK